MQLTHLVFLVLIGFTLPLPIVVPLKLGKLVIRAIVQVKQADYVGAEESATRALEVAPGMKNAKVLLEQIQRISDSIEQTASNQAVDTADSAKQI